VEKIHHDLYQKALESLEAGQEPKVEPYYVCSVCGNTVAGEAPERCPICGAPRSKFKKVE
jgi:rubrerythrin